MRRWTTASLLALDNSVYSPITAAHTKPHAAALAPALAHEALVIATPDVCAFDRAHDNKMSEPNGNISDGSRHINGARRD
jgi:hypothetical protein